MGTTQERLKAAHKTDFKMKVKQPILALEKRVFDSQQFSSLKASTKVVLMLFCRNLERDRNGHCFVTERQADAQGVSHSTFFSSLRELIAAGLIYMTRRGGHGQSSRFALTWLPLAKHREGLHCGNFHPFQPKFSTDENHQQPQAKPATKAVFETDKFHHQDVRNLSLGIESGDEIYQQPSPKIISVEVNHTYPVKDGWLTKDWIKKARKERRSCLCFRTHLQLGREPAHFFGGEART